MLAKRNPDLEKFLPTGPDWEFLHIPKTGGTSIEHMLRERGHKPVKDRYPTVRNVRAYGAKQSKLCNLSERRVVDLWHYTPEQISWCRIKPNPYEGKQVYCIIREPLERVISEYHYRMGSRGMRKDIPTDHHGKRTVVALAHKIASVFGNKTHGGPGLALTPPLLHLQPQSWYVFDSNGVQTCQRPVLFQSVMKAMRTHRNKSVATSQKFGKDVTKEDIIQLRHILRDVYKDDFEMYDAMVSSAATALDS